MSISTLSKITVPLDSNQSASNQGLLMPKLQYRFRVSLENFGVSTPTTELTKQVVDITRPNLSFETTTIDVYNSKVYLAGKHTWETVTLTLREDVSNNVQKLVGEQLQKQFEELVQDSETIQETLHEKIFEIRPTLNEDTVKSILKRIMGNELIGHEFNNNKLRVTLANLVPEYTPLDKDSTDPIVLNVKPEIEA